jgi:hypothetical protein
MAASIYLILFNGTSIVYFFFMLLQLFINVGAAVRILCYLCAELRVMRPFNESAKIIRRDKICTCEVNNGQISTKQHTATSCRIITKQTIKEQRTN